MTNDTDLMQQALEDICAARLCEVNSMSSRREALRLLDKAADALRERLAQPVQEPVAHLYRDHNGQLKLSQISPQPRFAFPVYTSPQPRQWIGLTDEEALEILGDIDADTKRLPPGIKAFARAIEQALREKNA